MSLPTVEEVQTAILKALDASGTINDSRQLSVGASSLASPEGQAVVKAALDSLLSKEVRREVGDGATEMWHAGLPSSSSPRVPLTPARWSSTPRSPTTSGH